VAEGSNLVTQSGTTLEQIVMAVKKVTDIVAEIAMASKEQSAGIEQVNKSVMHLDELTQQNAALVEEASAASQAMAEQARDLNGAMQRYRVNAVAGMANGAEAANGAGGSGTQPPVERRRSGRPWTDTRARATPAAATSPPARVVTDAEDPVWKEF
jgi:methyl-accepting chemotaxis protein